MYYLLVVFCLLPWLRASPINQRIIGGGNATAGHFPFTTAIFIQTADGRYFCGGSIIDPQWILTAAHCLTDAATFTIQLGSVWLESEDPNRQIVATVNSISHPQYTTGGLDHDIGLIKLHLPVEYHYYLRPSVLPTRELGAEEHISLSGWGYTSDFDTNLVDLLRYVSLSSISNEECQRTYGDQITENMLCAVGNYNEGSCTGDSGGPLIQTQKNGENVQFGVVSFTSQNGCESIDPSGFTRVFPYVTWIKETIGIN